jgi:hypothetical protein
MTAENVRLVARNAHTIKDDDVKTKVLCAASALLLALTGGSVAGFRDVYRGYATGKECYYGSGAYTMPTVAQCIDVCASSCPHLLADCAFGCAGGYPPNAYVEAMRQARESIDAGENIERSVLVIEAGMYHPDETVRVVAVALGSETKFVQVH